jgi:selenocysteine lyase/cysteine desulfurase
MFAGVLLLALPACCLAAVACAHSQACVCAGNKVRQVRDCWTGVFGAVQGGLMFLLLAISSTHRASFTRLPLLRPAASRACLTCAQVPVSCWGGRLWVRVSAQLYNELEDYRRLAAAVTELRGASSSASPVNGLANGMPPALDQM